VYELREKLSEGGELFTFILDSDRSNLTKLLQEIEDWLYEEGEDCNRQVYQDKLSDLKSKGEPIQMRRLEFELRPPVMEDFQRSLQLGMKAVEQLRANHPLYAHLTVEDVTKVEQTVTASYQWLELTRQKMSTAVRHLTPPITVAQIRQEKANYEGIINPILNKPPPKAPSPPKDESNSKEGGVEQKDQANAEQTNATPAAADSAEKMDCS